MNKVVIIVCNYNKETDVKQCVKSILESSYQDKDIIVIDNASEDNSVECLKKEFGQKIDIICNKENKGGAGGFNTGIKVALKKNYKYIMLADNDIIMHKNNIEELYYFLENNKSIGLVGSKIYQKERPEYIMAFGSKLDYQKYSFYDCYRDKQDNDDIPKVNYCDYVPACSLMVRTEIVKKVGLLPEDNFIYWDDIEWAKKISMEGHQVAALGSAKVWHPCNERIMKNTFWHYYMWRNRIYFWGTYLDETEKEKFAKTILEELFQTIFGCYQKGKMSIIYTLLYAYSDARYGIKNKVKDEKIFEIEKGIDKVEEMIKEEKVILIQIPSKELENPYQSLYVILRKMFSANPDIDIMIDCEIDMLEDIKEKIGFSELDKNHIYYGNTKQNKNFKLCEHVNYVKKEELEYIYIDRFYNMICDKKDFVYFTNFKNNCEMFVKCHKIELVCQLKKMKRDRNEYFTN